MSNARRWAKPLLWLHLFVCAIWLYLFRATDETPGWMGHVFIWSILGIQFTWGFTVGLLVGPGRKRRPLLWWSLMLIFLPLWFFSQIAVVIGMYQGPLIALAYLAIFVMILACETYGGVLLGAVCHSQSREE